MSIKSYFFNAKKLTDGRLDRLYNAESITTYLDGIVGTGVFPTPSTCLQVFSNEGFEVLVKAGTAWINGRKIVNTSDHLVTLDAADVVLNRIDRIVVRVDRMMRDIFIVAKKGIPTTNPTPPELTRSADIYEICLANIIINKQQVEIKESHIQDTRPDGSVCGYVTGLIQQIDTETLYKRFEAMFFEWFQNIKNNLISIGTLSEYKQTEITTNVNTNQVTINMANYIHGVDILNVYVNGMKLSIHEYDYDVENKKINFKKALDVIGTTIEISIFKAIKEDTMNL